MLLFNYDKTVYRIVVRSDQDSIWVREEIFTGTLSEMVSRFGSKTDNPLNPYIRNEKIYRYYFTKYNNGHWHGCNDPRSR